MLYTKIGFENMKIFHLCNTEFLLFSSSTSVEKTSATHLETLGWNWFPCNFFKSTVPSIHRLYLNRLMPSIWDAKYHIQFEQSGYVS